MAVAKPDRSGVARAALLVGAMAAAAGVVVAGTVARTAGGVAILAGWLVAIAGLHLYGRSGAPPAA